MAYGGRRVRRTYGRRSFARTRRYRTTLRKFRGVTRQGFGKVNLRQKRLPRRQARKRFIRNVASKKKWDTMVSARSVISGDLTATVEIPNGTTMYLFCPTYRFLDREYSNDHTRNAQDVFYRGFKERFWVHQQDGFPLMHRRVVFWAQFNYVNARPHVVPRTDQPPTYYRSFTPLTDTNTISYIFQGDATLDYSPDVIFNANLDRRRVQVISDTRKNLNSQNDTGKMWQYSTWVGANRRLSYTDEESGGSELSDPWVAPSPWQSGNLYILDFFTHGFIGLAEGGPAQLTSQSVSYWHEA